MMSAPDKTDVKILKLTDKIIFLSRSYVHFLHALNDYKELSSQPMEEICSDETYERLKNSLPNMSDFQFVSNKSSKPQWHIKFNASKEWQEEKIKEGYYLKDLGSFIDGKPCVVAAPPFTSVCESDIVLDDLKLTLNYKGKSKNHQLRTPHDYHLRNLEDGSSDMLNFLHIFALYMMIKSNNLYKTSKDNSISLRLAGRQLLSGKENREIFKKISLLYLHKLNQEQAYIHLTHCVCPVIDELKLLKPPPSALLNDLIELRDHFAHNRPHPERHIHNNPSPVFNRDDLENKFVQDLVSLGILSQQNAKKRPTSSTQTLNWDGISDFLWKDMQNAFPLIDIDVGIAANGFDTPFYTPDFTKSTIKKRGKNYKESTYLSYQIENFNYFKDSTDALAAAWGASSEEVAKKILEDYGYSKEQRASYKDLSTWRNDFLHVCSTSMPTESFLNLPAVITDFFLFYSNYPQIKKLDSEARKITAQQIRNTPDHKKRRIILEKFHHQLDKNGMPRLLFCCQKENFDEFDSKLPDRNRMCHISWICQAPGIKLTMRHKKKVSAPTTPIMPTHDALMRVLRQLQHNHIYNMVALPYYKNQHE